MQYKNKLLNEKSLYLKQHANNPVYWYPWGEEALKKAKKENKILFISIGYAACHWCHVMERETFQNEEISNILNKHFVSVKIDREERSDLDQTYMSAVQLMTGSGGWPLTCFATSEGKPFYGGTYFPPAQFLDIIKQLSELWYENPSKIHDHAENLCDGIKNSELISEKSHSDLFISVENIYERLEKQFDRDHGGTKQVPKFPMPVIYKFLIDYYAVSGNKDAIAHAELTINKILKGGIYDQPGGGIARYSTDRYWFVPHFEKMLYDNALFIGLLASIYGVTGKEIYLNKIHHTFSFLLGQLSNGSGGFYSSIDADSEGEEGKYYVWTAEELRKIADEHFDFISEYYQISESGNWEEGKNILKVNSDLFITGHEKREVLDTVNRELLKERSKRVPPAIDDKILTSWNALLCKSLIEIYNVTGDEYFLKKSLETAHFIKNNMVNADFLLKRAYQSDISGFLDDYAFTTEAFIELYQATFDEEWLSISKELINVVIDHFLNKETGMFFYSPDFEDNPVGRLSDISDNVLPSSNSSLAITLYKASVIFDNPYYYELSQQMLLNIQPYFDRSPAYFTNWASLLLLFTEGSTEIVITGPEAHRRRKEFTGNFMPGVFFAGSPGESSLRILRGRMNTKQTYIYVCHNKTCKMPVKTVDEAFRQLKSIKK